MRIVFRGPQFFILEPIVDFRQTTWIWRLLYKTASEKSLSGIAEGHHLSDSVLAPCYLLPIFYSETAFINQDFFSGKGQKKDLTQMGLSKEGKVFAYVIDIQGHNWP